ncbi:MAG: hypothetical protein JWP12_3045 [Bacteroidetes bacterium]|nr:hypothetical protein [Bacteroidota bacterium]
MKLVKKIIFAGCVLITSTVFAQRGKEGTVSITTANRIVNEYTTLSADAATGASTITVAASGLNANARFSGALATGDLIMIIQMQGVTINGETVEFPAGSGTFYGLPNDNTWGEITAYNNCGNYEFAEVTSVPNGTTITLDCGLKHDYTAAAHVQVIRVPRYNTLTITGSVTCQAWAATGFTGGIVAVEVVGNTTINSAGGITVSGQGFRGGSLTGDNASGLGGGQVAMPSNLQGADKGEGIAGYQADYTPYGGRYARGAAANAGGGADCHNSGGGGGSNGGSLSGWDGAGNPDVSGGAGWVNAWNLEGGGFATHTSPGGGRGGYSFSNTNRDATTEGPQPFQTSTANSWGGDSRENNGGWGGRPLDYTSGRLFLGGGGGAGDQDNNVGGDGGKGAGLVYLMSYGTVSGTGTIVANGANGAGSGHDGAGGGGAGGTVILNSVGAVSGISITANGGNGGSQAVPITATMQAEGPGGSGSGGYIAVAGGAITQTVNPGASGTTNSAHVTEFTPNGATKGAVGTANQTVTNFIINTTGATICAGNTASISATISGTAPAGSSILWYNTQVGGTSIGSGATFTTPVLGSSTTFYAGTCPGGTYREPVIVTVTPGPTITVNSPPICSGQTANLTANGGTTYTWTAGTTVTGTNTANASPTTTTTYTVTGTTGGCSGTAVSTVTVTPGPTVTVNSPGICAGQTAGLTANGGTSYTWTAGTTVTGTNTANATPGATTTYTVTGTTSGCSGTAVSTVTVTPLPVVSVNSPAICAGQTANLTANGGTTYTWTAGTTVTGTNTANATPAATTTYTVTGTTSSCSATAISTVTVNPIPTVTVNSPTVCAGQTANLSASGGTSYSWTAGTTVTGTNTADATPAATTTYTVTGTTSSCSGTAISTVTVTPLPTITVNSPAICAGQTANLSASGGTSYTWTAGTTVTGTNTADATPAATTSYTVTGTSSSCSSTAVSTVTVNALPTVTVNSPAICAGQTANLTANGGTSYTWTTGTTVTGTNTADASPVSTTTYTVTGTTLSCSGTAVATVTVNPSADPTITNISPVCASAAPFNLAAATAGGTWSGTGITDATNGTFNPATSGTGTFTITYVTIGTCGGTDTALVTVNSTLNSTITQPASICVGAAPFNLTAATNGGTWSGTGITNTTNGTFDPATAGTGAHVITYVLGSACGSTDTVIVNVTSLSDATIASAAPVCVGASAFNLNAATTGGNWSGTGITNASAGTFTPSTAGTGTFTITYAISGSCGNTDTALVTVTPNADATITQPASICVGAAAINLTAATTGGTWSGTGITNTTSGTFDPATAGIGTHTITYAITGSCANSDTVIVTVNAASDPTITSPGSVCIGASAFNFTAATAGGTWSGTGITDNVNGTFSPAAAGIGQHVITYVISGSCGATDTATVNVTSLSDATIASVSPVCVSGAAFNLNAATSGGSWSGTGISNTAAGTFNPSTAGVGTYVITYTIGGSCGNTDTVSITVTPQANASITAVAPVCINTSSFTLTAATSGGTWSGTGITDVTNGTFDPTIAGSGPHTITYSIAGSCGATATQTVTVNPLPTPGITSDVNSGCGPLAVQFFETVSTTCSSVFYDFGDGTTGTASSPLHVYSQSGLHNVVITCTDANGCSGTTVVSNMISVSNTPVASMTITPGIVVAPNTPVVFTDASSNGGIEFWNFGDPASGVNNNSTSSTDTHTYPIEGSYCITLLVANISGCVDSTTECITVVSDATVIVPNIFTPNGDGSNDEFFIITTGVKTLECTVYDRWGLKIAEWNSINFKWDGRTTSGNAAPDGTYYYLLKATGLNDKVTEKQGFLQLLRTK